MDHLPRWVRVFWRFFCAPWRSSVVSQKELAARCEPHRFTGKTQSQTIIMDNMVLNWNNLWYIDIYIHPWMDFFADLEWDFWNYVGFTVDFFFLNSSSHPGNVVHWSVYGLRKFMWFWHVLAIHFRDCQLQAWSSNIWTLDCGRFPCIDVTTLDTCPS